jgi:hypothetical protein
MEYLNFSRGTITNDANEHAKINPGLSWQKQHSTRRRLSLPAKLDLNLKEKTNEVLHMALKLGHFRK